MLVQMWWSFSASLSSVEGIIGIMCMLTCELSAQTLARKANDSEFKCQVSYINTEKNVTTRKMYVMGCACFSA